jgi:hypothetical protein
MDAWHGAMRRLGVQKICLRLGSRYTTDACASNVDSLQHLVFDVSSCVMSLNVMPLM